MQPGIRYLPAPGADPEPSAYTGAEVTVAPAADRIDELRRDLHAVDSRVVRLEAELKAHREQSALQHTALMSAVAELRGDLSDQGRTPVPPDPLSVTISPGKLLPWLKILVPILAAMGVGGGLGQALDHVLDPPTPVPGPPPPPDPAPPPAPAPAP